MRNRLVQIGVGGILFLLPFFIHPWTPYEALQIGPPKIIACFLFGCLLGAIILARRIHYSIGFSFFAFAASALVTGFGPRQLYPFIYFASAILAALWFLEQTARTREALFRVVVFSGAASAVYAIVQWMGYDPIFNYAPGVAREPIAFFGQTTKFGAFCAITGSMALALRMPLCYLIIAFGAIITGSSFTLLALGVGSLVALRRFPYGDMFLQAIFLCSCLLVAAVALLAPDSSFLVSHGRFEVWEATFKAFLENPVGYGPGSYGDIFPERFQPVHLRQYGDFIQAHNDYLQALFEFGLVGLVVMLALFQGVINYLLRFWWKNISTSNDIKAAEAGLLALAVNGMGNFPWQLAPHFFFGIVFLCLLLNRVKEDKIYEWPQRIYLP